MKIKFYIISSLLILFPSILYGANAAQPKSPPLGNVEIPRIERVTLDNGMKLFLVEDRELPVIKIESMIRTGSVYEPADKIGLAAITGKVMRTGGTTAKTGDQIDEELERIAASVEINIEKNNGTASLWTLKENFDAAIAIFADILMNPVFNQDKIDLAKIELRTDISRRNDDLFDIAVREYAKLIYGPSSVYARHTEYATVNNISRDDIVAFHKKFYHPNNIMLSVCGDFKTQEMVDKLKEVFKNWQKTDFQILQVEKVKYDFRRSVNLVCKNDLNQSAVVMGHIGGQMSDPNYFALVLMNRILGSPFAGRLFKNVRSRQGLTYDVFGYYRADYDHPGVFYVGCQTKSANTVRAIGAMTEEVKGITQSEAADEELALAKESFLNSFVFNFETKSAIVKRLMTYEYYGYPADFLQKTKENVEKVSKKDILFSARQCLKPDQMQVLIVGRPKDIGSLSQLGKVNEIDINIPPMNPVRNLK